MLFGFDLINQKSNFDFKAAISAGYHYCMIKVSESTHPDPLWPNYQEKVQELGIPFVGYLYIRGDTTAQDQVHVFLDHLGDFSIPVMLDFEDTENPVTMDLFWEIKNELEAYGVNIALSYIPQWFWNRLGQPDLSNISSLMASHILLGKGSGQEIYQDITSNLWAGYGGNRPVILQFSDMATIAGTYPVEVSAFRGTRQELQAIFEGNYRNSGKYSFDTEEKFSVEEAFIHLIKALHHSLIGSSYWEELHNSVTRLY